MTLQRVDSLCDSNNLVMARLTRTVLTNIFLVSHILLLFHSPKGSWNKLTKYEKLGRFWSYCTQRCAIRIEQKKVEKSIEFKGNCEYSKTFASTFEQFVHADKTMSNIYDKAFYENAVEYCRKRTPWCRSKRSQMFFKIGSLKNFAKFTAKHLSFFNKVAGLRPHGIGVLLWILRNFKEHLFS